MQQLQAARRSTDQTILSLFVNSLTYLSQFTIYLSLQTRFPFSPPTTPSFSSTLSLGGPTERRPRSLVNSIYAYVVIEHQIPLLAQDSRASVLVQWGNARP